MHSAERLIRWQTLAIYVAERRTNSDAQALQRVAFSRLKGRQEQSRRVIRCELTAASVRLLSGTPLKTPTA